MVNTKRNTLKTPCSYNARLIIEAVGNTELKTPHSQTAQINCQPHAQVYFTRLIDADHLIKLYNLANQGITGKVPIKTTELLVVRKVREL